MKMKKFATALWKRHGLPAALWLTFTAVGAAPAAQPAPPSPDMASPPALDPVELLRHAEREIATRALRRCRVHASRYRNMQYVGADVDADLAHARCYQRWCDQGPDAQPAKGLPPSGGACTPAW